MPYAPVRQLKENDNEDYPARVSAQEWNRWLKLVHDFLCPEKTVAVDSYEPMIAPLCIPQNSDPRPFVDVTICGHDFSCLLDSGASTTIIGAKGVDFFLKKKLNFVLEPMATHVTTADGTTQAVQGQILVPITFRGFTKSISCLVVPSIAQDIILGVNFGKVFGICFDFADNSYSFKCEQWLSSVNVITPLESLLPEQRAQLKLMIDKYLTLASSKQGATHLAEHFIDTGEARPFKQRQYPFSPVIQEQLNKEVDKMLKDGVIEKSNSPWSSPILMVRKKDGSYRPCFDGRKLNAITVKDSYPLPLIDNILNQLRDSRYLTSLDLTKAFWCIPLERSSRPKTAFQVHGKGLFQFKVMPFGLCNAAQSMQRLMDAVLGPELEKYVFVYLDDIVVATPTFELHLQVLKKVYDRLQGAGLNLNLDKCKFCRDSLSFLGFVIDHQGLHTDPQKVESVLGMKTPTTTTEVRRFIGLMQWYRRFIKDFSTLSAPITALLKNRKKGQTIVWTPEADASFEKLKRCLATAPVLASPDFSKPFSIQTDASEVGLGAVLCQNHLGYERPIAYASRTLNRQERNYSVTERECMAVLFGVEKFRGYVEGTSFSIITDHASLRWLYKLKDPVGRLARWCVRLSQFSFDIVHRKGTQHIVPDFLSRAVASITVDQLQFDSWYESMVRKVERNPEHFPDFCVENNLLYKHFSPRHQVESNLFDWKLVIPTPNRKKIMYENHDVPTSGHLGVHKTYCRIFERYYWPGMKKDIKYYVRTCVTCGANKHSNEAKPGLCGQFKEIDFPFQCISLDFMGPFPRSKKGNTQLLVVTDWFTKFILVQPMAKATATAVCKFLEEQVFLIFGVPQIIMSDNGVQFTSKEFKALMRKYKIHNTWYNANYHPQINFTERVNKVIGVALAAYIKENDHRTWDQEIHKVAQAIRTAQHEVTGCSPAFLMFGRNVPLDGEFYEPFPKDPCVPGDISNTQARQRDLQQLQPVYERVRLLLRKAYEKNAQRYNLRRRPLKFAVGDKVFRTNFVQSDASKGFSKKLAPKFVPCIVTKVLGTGRVYELSDLHGKPLGNFHVKDLKPFYERDHSASEDNASVPNTEVRPPIK